MQKWSYIHVEEDCSEGRILLEPWYDTFIWSKSVLSIRAHLYRVSTPEKGVMYSPSTIEAQFGLLSVS